MVASAKVVKGRRWQFADCEYVELSRTLLVSGDPVKMEAKPLDVLLQLLERPTEIVTKEELLNTVWEGTATTEQSLVTAISKLRKAFGRERDAIIVNETGIGYRMAVPVACTIEEQRGLPPVLLEPGTPIHGRPRWLAVRRLNTDPFSPVWLAANEETGEHRVYKFAGDGVRLRALQREIAVWRLLEKGLGPRASFAVRTLDWSFEQTPYFIESAFEGPNLLEWSSSPAFLSKPVDERVQLVASIADAVSAAHELGILHNDLKPANILIVTTLPASSQAGSSVVIKIVDFGVASLQDVQLLHELDITDHGAFSADEGEQQSTPRGTAMYRAPELHLGGPPTVQGDVYSLGVLLYQVVRGNFFQSPAPGWEDHISDPLLRQDIADAANVDPAHRITSVTALAERLHRLADRREQKRKAELELAAARRAQEAIARVRLRRPWVILAVCSLAFGLVVTLWSARNARRERDAERKHAAALSAMYNFLSQDLLGQSNPYLGVAGSGRAPQQTLVDAIATATPQIDGRFAREPEIAARLHETIADSLKSRTRFDEADREYSVAAQRYRDGDGPLSQAAITTELKREFTRLAAIGPGSIEAAQSGYAQQEKLIAQIKTPTIELQTWQTLVKTALIGFGPHPEQALPLLNAALQRAQAAPSPDPQLIFRLKNQLCGTYVRLGDGPNLERVSRDIISMLTQQHGADSATLFPFQMYVEEALYLQNKYKETVAQADQNFSTFSHVLGPDHQLTLATLATRAAAEGQLQEYDAAIRDDLALHDAEQDNPNPAARRMEEGSLNDAAVYECHLGRFQSGLEHAREVLRETGRGPAVQPMFYNGSLFTVADCLLAEQESGRHRDVNAIREAVATLKKIDPQAMAEYSGQDQYQGFIDLAFARAAVLQGDSTIAREYAIRAQPFLKGPGADPYEQKLLASTQRRLGMHLQTSF